MKRNQNNCRNILALRVIRLIAAVAFPLLPLSCATTKATSSAISGSDLRPVYITNSRKISLLPPENTSTAVDSVQLLSGRFGDSSFFLMAYTEIDSTGISLSLFNDFGTDMGNVQFDGNTVSFDSAYFPSALPGEYIIADIQNAYYDVQALKKNYAASGLRFEVSENESEKSQTRYIYSGKKLIEEIKITGETVSIKNYLRGYEYNLQSPEAKLW